MNPSPEIKNLNFEKCCIDRMAEINKHITSAIQLNVVTIPADSVFKVFFYPPGYHPLASVASTSWDIKTHSWKTLGDFVKAVPTITCRMCHQAASLEYLKHVQDNKSKLMRYWEGVVCAFKTRF